MALFPAIPNPVVTPVATTAALALGGTLPTILLEFDTPVGPDFGVDPAGRLMLADAQQTWMQAGLVASLVQRAAYPVFPRWFGWDIEAAMRRPSRGQAEADIKRGITYAWVRCTNGRTAAVDQFRFVWGAADENADLVEVHFRGVPLPGLGLRPTTLAVIL